MITREQREARRKHIGSSDIAALFTDKEGKSLDPFKTAADVWAEKCYEMEDDEETAAQSRGNRYESALIEYATSELGETLVTNPQMLSFVCKDHPVLACNLDAFTSSTPPKIVEAKTTGIADEWGEPGTDQIPFRVLLQVQHQMICSGFTEAYVVVLMGRFGLKEEIYHVEESLPIQAKIIARAEQFWNDYVLTKTPPPDSEPGHIQVFKRIVREPESYGEVPEDVLQEWIDVKDKLSALEKDKEVAWAKVLLHLKDAEGARMPDGRILTYLKQKGADKIDRGMLKQMYPDVYAAVTSPNNYRVARIVKEK